MAASKSKEYPHQWPDGSWHSITYQQHVINTNQKATTYNPGGYTPGTLTPAEQAAIAGAGGGTAPGAPALPPTAPAPTAQPVDPNLENARLIGSRNIAIGKGAAAYDTGNLGFDYGYNPDGTPNMANPYSRAALYQLDYEHQKAGSMNSYAAMGQFNSGAYGRAQAHNDRTYAMNDAGNRLAYQRGLHGIQTGQLGTVANAGTGVSDADFAALLKSTYPGS